VDWLRCVSNVSWNQISSGREVVLRWDQFGRIKERWRPLLGGNERQFHWSNSQGVANVGSCNDFAGGAIEESAEWSVRGLMVVNEVHNATNYRQAWTDEWITTATVGYDFSFDTVFLINLPSELLY
jgi:hypothetical protein